MKKNLFPKTEDPLFLASYMAGFFEADACLTPRKHPINKNEVKTYELQFSFSRDDLEFAKFLKERFEIGQINEKRNEHCVVWAITKNKNVIDFLSFINGFIRGPKTVIVAQALKFYNEKYNLTIPIHSQDSSPILSNAWLSGFSDGDSTFQISLSKQEPNTVSLIPFYSLEVAEFYTKCEEEAFKDHKSNILYMQPLADVLETKLERHSRVSSLRIRATRIDNIKTLINYFSDYPLFSSKFYNYQDWVQVINLRDNAKANKEPYITIYDAVLKIKANFNSTRDYSILTWDHLKENFPLKPLNYPNHTIKLWKRKPSKDDNDPTV